MYFHNKLDDLQLDILGIVAILGEGSVLRNAQASALSWHHVLPRLLPAPQALIKHNQAHRLPTQTGIVIGVYSGNVREELNFFTRLLHSRELRKNQVEVVTVTRDPGLENKPIYGVNRYGVLPALSILGCIMSGILLALSVWQHDGFALIATVLLSVTSTIVGFASRWKLLFNEEKPKEDRAKVIPDGDVVIFYPELGAFRVVRCNEVVSRLYFQAEECVPFLSDNLYRVFAMFGSVTLIFGLICLGNSQPILQLSFAAAYVLLNALYWASSALKEIHHWSHTYKINEVELHYLHRAGSKLEDIQVDVNPVVVSAPTANANHQGPTRTSTTDMEAGILSPLKRNLSSGPFRRLTGLGNRQDNQQRPELPRSMENFTSALWTVIALTGRIRWLRTTHIVPDNEVWDKWVAEAGVVADKRPLVRNNKIILPRWEYQERLKELFREQSEKEKRRPRWPTLNRLSKLVSASSAEPKFVQIVREAEARLMPSSTQPTSPSGLQKRKATKVQFADTDVLTQSPVDAEDEGHGR